MRFPVVRGNIKRRMLINFRVDAAVMQKVLPAPFRPKLHEGCAVAGICLIRLEGIRPAGFPRWAGFASENAAHRIAVEWEKQPSGEKCEGVFIPRRDTGSWVNHVGGGRVFPGEHHMARFRVVDDGCRVEFSMESRDKAVRVSLCGFESDALPSSSCFASVAESSRFFENGSLGYSVSRDAGHLDGLRLETHDWRVRGLTIERVESSFFADRARFPDGSVEFDHALMMRDIQHEWHQVPPMFVGATKREGER